MPRSLLLTFSLILLLAPAARAEILPSFDVVDASRHASHLVVVEDGKVVESWIGDLKPGTQLLPAGEKPSPMNVEYSFRGIGVVDEAEQERLLAKRGLKRVIAVSGKRMVLFLARENPESWESKKLNSRPEYNTVWLEEGQAFAIMQWINPGPSGLQPLNMTEAELKSAVQEIHTVHHEIQPLLKERDRAKRAEALVKMLDPETKWRNREVHEALRTCGPAAWPVIEPLLFDEKLLPLHHGLIHVAYHVGRTNTKDAMLRIKDEERAYRAKLKADGIEFKDGQPPFSHHHFRDSAAQWALDSIRLNK
jgi:hypothetical protein